MGTSDPLKKKLQERIGGLERTARPCLENSLAPRLHTNVNSIRRRIDPLLSGTALLLGKSLGHFRLRGRPQKDKMRTEYGYRGPSVIAVLLVSSVQQDHNRFEQILSHSKWEVHHANTEREGVRSATRHSVPTVICDCGLPDGTWQDMFAEFERIENGPNLIVTCGPADARLWAEALSLGAYDVLAKPFHDEEVIRVVRSAWRNWIDRAELRSVGAEKGAAAQRR